MGRLDRAIALTLSAMIAFFGFVPIANWLPGQDKAPWYNALAADLGTSLFIAVGAGAVLAIVSRRTPVLWRTGLLSGIQRGAERHWTAWVAGIAGLAMLCYVWVALDLFSGRPLLIDEIVQVFQGRILATGHFWIPTAPHPEFFASLNLVEQGGRVYGQFPMGGPAMSALGTLVGAEWVVGPFFGAVAVVVFGAILGRVESRPGARLGALLLFAFAPFAVFMSGSHMNHVPTLCWLLIGMWGLMRATAEDSGRFGDGLVAGLGFGIAATIRPVDAMAFALPAGAWLLMRAVRQQRAGPLLGSGIGIALPIAALLWANVHTTGAPLLFGYTVLWGTGHDLGFHQTPWGPVHTPARGLQLINLYFLRLQTYLFEAAGPSLIAAVGALALTRRLGAFDRYLIASAGLLIGSYFAYWHDGFYLGPRFMYPLLPLLALWTARLLPAIRDRSGDGILLRTATYAAVIALLLGVATSVPIRVRQYQSGMLTTRWDADRAAERAGVRNALVVVRESWGAELVARMWGAAISRPDADAIFRAADPCRLDSALTDLEASDIRGVVAAHQLRALLGDSVRLVSAESITGDRGLRLTPGVAYPARCLAKIEANRSGFTLFPPLLLARRFGNIYARDLGARDSLLLREHPGRQVFLLKPLSSATGAEPMFHPLRIDSLFAAWRRGE